MQDLYTEVSACYLTYADGLTELQCQKKFILVHKWNVSEPEIPIWYSDMRNPEDFKDKFKAIQDKVGLSRVVNSHRVTF